MADDLELGTWTTPAGNAARLWYRAHSSDWNTVSACLPNPLNPETGDEYDLPMGLSGWGLDVGAHIGSVTIGLLLDNPEMRVVAVEALSANVEMLRRNLAENAIPVERVVVIHGAVSDTAKPVAIRWNGHDDEIAREHRYIGGIAGPEHYDVETVRGVTLAEVVKITGGAGFAWTKIDCEGGEHAFLRGRHLAKLALVTGEWHDRWGKNGATLAEQMDRTHLVTVGEGSGAGPFTAVAR